MPCPDEYDSIDVSKEKAMFDETTIDMDEETRRRLILIIDEDMKHGEGTNGMGYLLGALMHCDRVVIKT